MKKLALILPVFLLAGCHAAKNFVDLDCSDVAASAVSISKGALVTLDNRTLLRRDDKHIVCHATGGFSDGAQKLVRFQAFINDDGDEIVRYDTDEYQAAQQAKEQQEEEREERKAEQALVEGYSQFQTQVRSAIADNAE